MTATTLVVPTLGRPSLRALLASLGSQSVPLTGRVVLVDDRPSPAAPLDLDDGAGLGPDVELTLLRSGGRGPAATRNLGWRHARTPWVSFLDDDVVVTPTWHADLVRDLERAEAAGAVGSQGRVHVPLPRDRRPTDWERGTAGLETARWITADLSYRRRALASVGGFDERFRRAFREDSDLALRLGADTGTIAEGSRLVHHPVRPADAWASVRQQAGNADDVLMGRLHGRGWHRRAEAPEGRRRRHLVVTAAALTVGPALATGHRTAAAVAAAAWAAGTAELAAARIAPGPRDRAEVARMVATSAVIPAAATWHLGRGLLRHRRVEPWRGLPDLVLLDRDGTLVHDVPYNGDPTRVVPVPGARAALDRLRRRGVRLGLVTNQSGIGSGRITRAQADAVNERVAQLLGPFDTVQVCPHTADDGCRCRKPQPGMVESACRDLDVAPAATVMIGDIGADVAAARSAGALGVLVPTPHTRRAEVSAVRRCSWVLPDLRRAVDVLEDGRW